jgi:FkbM family methyltransferase
LNDLVYAVSEINKFFYHFSKLSFEKDYDINNLSEPKEYFDEIKHIITAWENSIFVRNQAMNNVDEDFWDIYEYFKYVGKNDIYNNCLEHFKTLPEDLKDEFISLPKRYTFLKGKIDYTAGDFSLIEEHISLMSSEIENYKWLYDHLADYRSKKILNGIIKYWYTFDYNQMHSLIETLYSDYYDLDILKCHSNEVFVDLGAYIGDSVYGFINAFGEYKKIYAYEVTPKTFEKLKSNLKNFNNAIPIQKGVGKCRSTMYITDSGYGAGNSISEEGTIAVSVVSLDEDISEPISIIKMDIEGTEKDAILGSTGHIKNEKPKLLVSAYHIPSDLFKIPLLIHDIRDDYKYYLRFNGYNCLWPCDYVLFAV